jgi:hypothetical protein
MGNFRYRGRPIRPLPPVFPVFGYYPFYFWRPYYGFGPRWGWGFNSCWSWAYCDLFSNWGLGYNVLPFYAYTPPPPTYAYPLYGYGDERRDLPQLYLKDGTVVTVTDYWLVDGQIHFTVIEEGTTRPVEHIVPLDELDLQRTTDMATQRGFRFVLRNQPLEHYLRSHPDGELEHPRDDQN